MRTSFCCSYGLVWSDTLPRNAVTTGLLSVADRPAAAWVNAEESRYSEKNKSGQAKEMERVGFSERNTVKVDVWKHNSQRFVIGKLRASRVGRASNSGAFSTAGGDKVLWTHHDQVSICPHQVMDLKQLVSVFALIVLRSIKFRFCVCQESSGPKWLKNIDDANVMAVETF